MQRILVMGVSSGAGKSTFARRLGDAQGLPVYHLDAIFWKPGWIEASPEEFVSRQAAIAVQDSWIIEGNYTGDRYNDGFRLRAARADTLIYLEVPLAVCLFRVVKRWLTHLGQTRPDMGAGCPEKLDWEFLHFIITTYRQRRRAIHDRLQAFEASGPDKRAVWLRGRPAIADYLRALESSQIEKPMAGDAIGPLQ